MVVLALSLSKFFGSAQKLSKPKVFSFSSHKWERNYDGFGVGGGRHAPRHLNCHIHAALLLKIGLLRHLACSAAIAHPWACEVAYLAFAEVAKNCCQEKFLMLHYLET